MKSGLPLLLGLAAILAGLPGCSTTARFYPVQGPLSEAKPLPVIRARVDGIMGDTGLVSLTLPDGEVCRGQWSLATAEGRERRGQAVIMGDKGTVIELEFYVGSGTAHGFGLAKDNSGNTYRVLF